MVPVSMPTRPSHVDAAVWEALPLALKIEIARGEEEEGEEGGGRGGEERQYAEVAMPESEAREVIDLVGEEEEEMCAPSSRMKGIAASHERGVSRHVGQSQPRCRLSPASSEGKGETDDDVVMLEQSPVAAVCAMTDLEGKTAGVEEKRGGRKRPRPRTMYLRLQAAQGWEEGDKTAMQIKKHGQGAAGGGGGGGRGSGYGEWQLSVTQDTEVEASMHEWRQLVLEEEGRDQKAYVDACFPPDLSALTGRAQDRGRTGGEEGKERGAAGKEGGKGGGKR
ncbi:hypothetical protein NSK_008771 [Nannochloropsis salina CCMP1776]|uniref:Uncharacterized protein n=1 Tax=Nannochloropsis salina CCMP1776 TaxID=1027361 RepID=A0A4D9CN07_9STRA|nr:hypothetical protein NSK_008771 [Nannochloropsis salina CCMP1776]|eukprot:TFJ79894.1 hypothetical protein NSK_008771 [Nannochloropsis salina CCMP1776]